MIVLKNCGQATVEYIFILAFAVLLGFKIVGPDGLFPKFFQKTMGRVGSVLSSHLTVGVCSSNCFFESYSNTSEPPP